MINKNSVCVCDADFLIAQIMENDPNHSNAVQITQRLVAEEAKVLFPTSALVEAATAIQRRYNNPSLANELLQQYKDPNLLVLAISQDDFIESTNHFDPNASKHHTSFDCLILALAKNHKVDLILSFDEFYDKKGFVVAKNLIEESLTD
jgi:predicted nucleic acid-binding protein